MKDIILKYLCCFSLLTIGHYSIFGQCDVEQEIHNYLKENLEYDTCSLYNTPITTVIVDFTYYDEEIAIDYKRFGLSIDSIAKVERKIEFESLNNTTINTKYSVFHSMIQNQYVMIQTLYNLPEYYYRMREGTEFEKRSSQGWGISYLFILNDKSCIKEIKKTITQYE